MKPTRPDVHFYQCSRGPRRKEEPVSAWSGQLLQAPPLRPELTSSLQAPPIRLPTLISPPRYFPQDWPSSHHTQAPPLVRPSPPGSAPPTWTPRASHFCASEGRPGHASPQGSGQRRRQATAWPAAPRTGTPRAPRTPVASGERARMGASGGRPPQKPRILGDSVGLEDVPGTCI